MKKQLIIGVVALLLIVGYLAVNDGKESLKRGIVSESVTITLFESGGKNTGNALIRVPFLSAVSGASVSVALNNGEESIEVISNRPTNARKDWNSGFYFETFEGLEEVTSGVVNADGTDYTVSVSNKKQVLGDLIDLSTVTNPEESMKGLGRVAYAQENEIIEVTYDNVPDITQRPGECAPTAAANSLIDLVNRNGGEELGDPRELIEDLKNKMRWTTENGVLPDDFVVGKNAWAAENNLPIVTTKVGDANGVSTIEEVKKALDNGDGVELRLKFATNDLQGLVGHMVTVTGYHTNGTQTYLDISDPYTEDSGTESIEIRSNQVTNYGPWGQITVLSWGFVQTWTTPEVEVEETSSVSILEETATEVFRASVEETQETTFAHVVPGEYSEIYSTIVTTPGNEVKFKLTGPGVLSPKNEVVIVADENGVANMTWKINQFGIYDAMATIEPGIKLKDIVIVE